MNDITAICGIKNRDERIINEVIVKYSKLLWPIASAVLKNVGSEQDVALHGNGTVLRLDNTR